jgi:hypothetical protein
MRNEFMTVKSIDIVNIVCFAQKTYFYVLKRMFYLFNLHFR